MEDLKNNNSFEDQLTDLLSDFEAEPSSRVWDRIEHRLDDRDGIKRFNKKLIIQWSIAASIVMGFVFASVSQLFFNNDIDNVALNNTPVIQSQDQPNNFINDQPTVVRDTLQKTPVKEQPKVLLAAVEKPVESKAPVYDFQETIKKRNEQKANGEKIQEPIFADNVQEKSSNQVAEPVVSLDGIESPQNDAAPVLLAVNDNQAYLVNVKSLAQAVVNSVQNISKINRNSDVVRYKFGLKNINVSGTHYK